MYHFIDLFVFFSFSFFFLFIFFLLGSEHAIGFDDSNSGDQGELRSSRTRESVKSHFSSFTIAIFHDSC